MMVCQNETHARETLAPFIPDFYPARRFLECRECGALFWWDGPSVLPEKDQCRKRRWSGRLVELTAADREHLRCL